MKPASASVTSHHVAKGVGTTMLARLAGVIDVVAQPLYVWLFGIASYGLYTVLWALVNLIENVADLGMTSALQRTVPQAETDADAVASLAAALALGVFPCLLIAIIVSLVAPQIAPLFNVAEHDQAQLVFAIRLFVWALPLWAFVEIATSSLRARRLFGPEIRLRLFWEQVVRLVLAIALWAAGFGITGLFMAHIISLAVTCGLAARMLGRHYRLDLIGKAHFGGPIMRDTLKAGLSVLPTNIVAQLFTDGPPVLLNVILPGVGGATAAGLYGIARKIASIIQLFRTAFAYVLAPLASAAANGNRAEVQPLYAFTTRLSSALVIPLAAVMAAGAPAILRLFGPAAAVAAGPLVILILARLVEAMAGAAKPVQQVVSGYGQQVHASVIGLVLAAVLLPLAIRLDPLNGTAGAVAVGLIAVATIPVWQLRRTDNLHPFEPPFLRVILVALGVALAAFPLALAVSLLLPAWLQLPLLLPILLVSVWCSCRIALPEHDRVALGKTAIKLRLL